MIRKYWKQGKFLCHPNYTNSIDFVVSDNIFLLFSGFFGEVMENTINNKHATYNTYIVLARCKDERWDCNLFILLERFLGDRAGVIQYVILYVMQK